MIIIKTLLIIKKKRNTESLLKKIVIKGIIYEKKIAIALLVHKKINI